MIRKRILVNSEKINSAQSEVHTWEAMGHNNRNIATYHDAAVDYVSNTLYIYMDYYPGGNVQGLLNEVHKLQPILALEICSAIASGIACCHENGIFHRTFTLADILLKQPLSQINRQLLAYDQEAPLYPLSGITMQEVSCQCSEIIQRIREQHFHGSVGHQVVIEGSEYMNASASLDVPPFVAPQFQHQGPAPAISEKADNYVLGVLCHILLTEKSPFPSIQTPLEWPSGFSTALRDLVLRCLDSDLEARPEASKLRDQLRCELNNLLSLEEYKGLEECFGRYD
jgi:serine/threonine protein kinase